MKTLVRDGMSVFILEDDEYVAILDNKTIIGSPPKDNVADCNNTNTVLYTNVSPPQDWIGLKYFFDGTTWTANPNYPPAPQDRET